MTEWARRPARRTIEQAHDPEQSGHARRRTSGVACPASRKVTGTVASDESMAAAGRPARGSLTGTLPLRAQGAPLSGCSLWQSPATALLVRPAVSADADALGEVHAESWRVAYAGLFQETFLERAAGERRSGWSNRLLSPWLQQTTLLVGVDDGRVAAFFHGGPSEDQRGVHEVFGFYVHPDAWGTGAAGELMAQGMTCLAGSGDRVVVLWTLCEAHRARRFYEKSGWSLTDKRRTRDFGDHLPRQLVQYQRPLG